MVGPSTLDRRRSSPRSLAADGYDAIVDKKRRKPPRSVTQSEESLLDQSGRRKLAATTRDLRRNVAIAAWAIRKHLDFVTHYEFHSREKDKGFNRDLEGLMTWWSRPNNCDRSGRHPLPKLIRLAETCRTVDNDVGLLKLASGHLQGIEGDRIRNPDGRGVWEDEKDRRWANGVYIDRDGRALRYGVHRRINGGSAFEFEREVRASRMCLHGFFDRFDQVRGVSPIVAALNPMRDVYENFDHALAAAKIRSLFALAFYREGDGGLPGSKTTGTDEDGNGKDDTYEVKFGRGPFTLDLDPGDRAEFLESRQPSSEFQAFTNLVIGVALKALDIPFNFWDESHTNFFGSRAAWLLYDRSCVDKRNSVRELLRQLTVWRLQLWIQDGILTLPKGKTLATLKWEYIFTGMPWWDQAKEVKGDLAAIGACLTSPQRVCREHGQGDFYDNVDQRAEAESYAAEKGVALSFDPGPEPMEVTSNDG